jgi:hypothetical protein
MAPTSIGKILPHLPQGQRWANDCAEPKGYTTTGTLAFGS